MARVHSRTDSEKGLWVLAAALACSEQDWAKPPPITVTSALTGPDISIKLTPTPAATAAYRPRCMSCLPMARGT